MLFYKVLILFWGVLEHALMLGGSKNALFFTYFTSLQLHWASLAQTARLVPGLMKAAFRKIICVVIG